VKETKIRKVSWGTLRRVYLDAQGVKGGLTVEVKFMNLNEVTNQVQTWR
jgi:hypothetical protein